MPRPNCDWYAAISSIINLFYSPTGFKYHGTPPLSSKSSLDCKYCMEFFLPVSQRVSNSSVSGFISTCSLLLVCRRVSISSCDGQHLVEVASSSMPSKPSPLPAHRARRSGSPCRTQSKSRSSRSVGECLFRNTKNDSAGRAHRRKSSVSSCGKYDCSRKGLNGRANAGVISCIKSLKQSRRI